MKKYVITWTFMRHIHRQREYRIVQRVLSIPKEYDVHLLGVMMYKDEEVGELHKRGFNKKMEAITFLEDVSDTLRTPTAQLTAGLHNKEFDTPDELQEWANSTDGTDYIISICQDSKTRKWLCFYIIENI